MMLGLLSRTTGVSLPARVLLEQVIAHLLSGPPSARELFSIRALISSYRAGLAWAIYDRPIRRLRRFILPFLITEFAPRTAAALGLRRAPTCCSRLSTTGALTSHSSPFLYGAQVRRWESKATLFTPKAKGQRFLAGQTFRRPNLRERKLGAVLTAHQFSNSGYCANVDGKVK